MLGHAVNAKKAADQARQSPEVIDVAQLLVRSVTLREQSADAAGGTGARPPATRREAGGLGEPAAPVRNNGFCSFHPDCEA